MTSLSYVCVLVLCYRVYQRQGRAEEALSQCEKALELQRDGGQLSRNCLIYRNMAAIEQTQGHLDRAIEHLLQVNTAEFFPDSPVCELYCIDGYKQLLMRMHAFVAQT